MEITSVIVNDKILDDLTNRGLTLGGLIMVDENKQLQFLSYDENGLVKFLSDKVDAITINERLQGRMVRPIVDLTFKQTE